MKAWIRKLIELPNLDVARSMLVRRDASKEADFLSRSASTTDYRVLEPKDLLEDRSNHNGVFYILGSGSSVEDLSPKDFAEIRQGVSVGINAWVLHGFVPNIYAYEPVENSSTDHYRTLSYLNRSSVIAAQPYVLILRPRNSFEWQQLEQVPPTLKKWVRIYGRVSPFTRCLQNLKADLVLTMRLLSKSQFAPILVDSGASIVRMAHLGMKLGFKRIVFVGVDLNHVEYFWERNQIYLSRRGLASFDSGQTGEIHETMNAASRPFPILQMLEKLAEVARSQFGCEFMVASSRSALAQVIPVHDWKRR